MPGIIQTTRNVAINSPRGLDDIEDRADIRGDYPLFPWDDEWWKPTGDPIRDLTKAGALVAAEIDRWLRLSPESASSVHHGNENHLADRDKQKPLPSLSVTEAHPKEEGELLEALREWKERADIRLERIHELEAENARFREKDAVSDSHPARQIAREAELAARVAELEGKLNAPELLSFRDGTVLEAAHQRERWGSEHDAGKEPQDWFWLVGYLSGKALRAHIDEDTDKALHHTISSAAALANWHAAILGANNVMRPGISAEKQEQASSVPHGNDNELQPQVPQTPVSSAHPEDKEGEQEQRGLTEKQSN